jgi:hypothetical protein
MQFPNNFAIDILAVTIVLYLFVIFRDHRRRRGFPYPPSPPSLPVIGNLLDVPTGKEAPWLKYEGISKKYGRVHSHYYTIPFKFANADTCINRRRVLSSSLRTSHCGAQLAICNQGSTREARRNTLGSAYVSHSENVGLTVFGSNILQVNIHHRLELDWLLPFSKMGESWREERRLMDRGLRSASDEYRHMMKEKTGAFLAKLLATPCDFRRHIDL